MALTRKTAIFAGNEIGSENKAMLASLVATCKMSGVNPVDCLDTALCAIHDGHPKGDIEDLMPWRFRLPSSRAALGRGVARTSDPMMPQMHMSGPLTVDTVGVRVMGGFQDTDVIGAPFENAIMIGYAPDYMFA